MKWPLLLSLGFILSLPAQAHRAAFEAIAAEASVANGSADIEVYNVSLSKQELQAHGQKELTSEYWENCGPWTTTTSRRQVAKKIIELEGMADETTVAQKITDLLQKNQIRAVVGARSNTNVECSLTWFNVYGYDGTVLKLRYNWGD
jgi:aspartokinase